MKAKENRVILDEDNSLKKILEGAEAVYGAVGTSYGPKGKNVTIEQPFGRPIVTRDGVTIARAVYFSDRGKNVGAQQMTEASETTNRIAGDGTSATVVLGYNLLDHSVKALNAGQHPMDVSETLKKDRELLLEKLDTIVKPVKKGQLEHVATVSSGNPLVGKLIAEAIEYVGDDGGIIAEKAPVNDVEREYVDGYYLQSGFNALQSGKKEVTEPHVIVSIRPLRSRSDAIEVVNAVAKTVTIATKVVPQPLKLLIVGNIEGDAMASFVDAVNKQVIDAVIVTPPPSFGSMSKELLEDIALYAHCSPITELTRLSYPDTEALEFSSFIGKVDRVVASKTDTTIFGAGTTEDIEKRIADLKEQSKVEVSDQANERIKDRIAKLEGKIALFRIGAPTDSAKEELEFRVEDAINATRGASQHGIVPGGGTTLLELSKVEGLSEVTRKSLTDTFRKLLINANLPSEVKLQEALNAPSGHGFNLRSGDELVDMVKEGVVDPKIVTEQTIINATDVVSTIITTGNLVLFEDTEE